MVSVTSTLAEIEVQQAPTTELPECPYDAELFADVRNFYQQFYHVALSDEQLHGLMGEGPLQ